MLLLQHQVMCTTWVVTAGRGSSCNIHCPCHVLKMAFLTAKLDTFVVLLSQTISGEAEKAGTKDHCTRVPYMAWLSSLLRLSFLTRFFAAFQVSCPSYSCCVTHELVGSYLLRPLQSGLLFFYSFLTLTPCLSCTVLFIYLMLLS